VVAKPSLADFEKNRVLALKSTPASPEPELQAFQFQLPEEPLVVIERSKAWVAVNLRDLWDYRELLYFLAWRDLKVRYKQTVLGVLWVVMQPALMTIIFTLFLGNFARVPSMGKVPYALFAYSGLLLWIFFSGAVSVGSQSLIGNANLITKIYFPRLIIPCAVIGGRLVDLLISLVLLAALMSYYRMAVTRSLLVAPIFLVLIVLLSLGFSMLTSALSVRYRDVGIALPVLIQLWMFASPIVYPLSLVPQRWQGLYAINPLVGILEGFRACLFNFPINRSALAISVAETLILLVYSAYTFKRIEKGFADVI
jgi:lipopolysaccharide transport system permease protein